MTGPIFHKLVKGYKNLKKGSIEAIPVNIVNIPEIKRPLIQLGGFPQSPQMEMEIPLEIKRIEGVEIPEFARLRATTRGLKEREEEEKPSFIYPLIPERPTKDDPVLAYAKVFWNPQTNRYEYHVIQPKLNEKLTRVLKRVKDILEEKLDVDFTKMKEFEAKEYLHGQIKVLTKYFGIDLTEEEYRILLYYVDRDFLGLGLIEPLMHDGEIEDISCDGANIPIFVFHRNPRIGSIITNIIFQDRDDLDSYLIRLAQLTGKSISVLIPLLDGTLPEGSRIQGTLGTDIAKKGSNFTIRKFTKFPLTPTHFLNYETVDIKTLAFLWLAVDNGHSILISGGVATGKTSFLNVLSLFIKPEMKIVSIEDTGEIQLPHPHWIPHVARVAISTETGRESGEVDLFALLKESLRQRPDYIIVGEVRGKEAYVLFQQMATGHASLATIHADSFDKLVDRLITPPIDLPASLIESLDIITFLANLRYRGKFVRKLESVYEVIGFNYEKHRPIVRNIIEWNSTTDKWDTQNKSAVLERIKKKTGLTDEQIKEELNRRMFILHWMREKNIINYLDVGRIVNLYYTYPEQVLETIQGEL